MKWVTKDYVHMDRVASPWLIKRFIDPEAEFVFVPWGKEAERPADAIPFSIAGTEFGPHDADGTTFQKILKKYAINDPALERLGKVIAAGVAYVMHGYRPGADDHLGQVAVGLLAVSEGVMYSTASDPQILAAGFPLYDALYANFKVEALLQSRGLKPPAPKRPGPGDKIDFLRQVLKDASR